MKTAAAETDLLVFEEQEARLLESHTYWWKKRILFNILLGIAGLLPTVYFASHLTFFDLLGIGMWAFVANAFYSYGYVLESFIITRSKGKKNMRELRGLLFWLGTLAYIAASILYAIDYFSFQT